MGILYGWDSGWMVRPLVEYHDGMAWMERLVWAGGIGCGLHDADEKQDT